jgi:hypothetical protein
MVILLPPVAEPALASALPRRRSLHDRPCQGTAVRDLVVLRASRSRAATLQLHPHTSALPALRATTPPRACLRHSLGTAHEPLLCRRRARLLPHPRLGHSARHCSLRAACLRPGFAPAALARVLHAIACSGPLASSASVPQPHAATPVLFCSRAATPRASPQRRLVRVPPTHLLYASHTPAQRSRQPQRAPVPPVLCHFPPSKPGAVHWYCLRAPMPPCAVAWLCWRLRAVACARPTPAGPPPRAALAPAAPPARLGHRQSAPLAPPALCTRSAWACLQPRA